MTTKTKKTYYLVQYSWKTNTKNKLQENVSAFMGMRHKKVVAQEEVEMYKQEINNQVKSLNERYKRCAPERLLVNELDNGDCVLFTSYAYLTFYRFEL